MKRRRPPPGFSPETKALIEERAQSRCERCGGYYSDCVAHHRRPRGLGGSKRDDTNVASNAGWLCSQCHNIVESHRSQALEDGWLVKQSQFPADVPVLRRGVWVELRDNGDIIPHATTLRAL